jgi:group I intron endonuclease
MESGNVYMIINPEGKIYIGSTSKSFEERWKQYYSLNCKKQNKIYNSLVKYGVENHIFKKVWTGNINLMLKNEAILGRCFNVLDRNIGLNLALPKINDIYKCISEETREKLRISKKNISSETRLKMRNAALGTSRGKGRIKSEEHKRNISLSKTGIKQSLETVLKCAESRKIPIIQYDLNWNFIKELDSVKNAGEYLKIDRSITKCCKGNKEYPSSGKFKWKYKNK